MGFIRFKGVTYANPDLVYDTFILFTGADSITRLIDLNGKVVHKWPFPGVPPRFIDPALTSGQRGELLVSN